MKKNLPQTSEIEYESPSLLRIFASMVYDSLLLIAVSLAYGALVVGLRVLILGRPEIGQRVEWNLWSGSFITVGWLFVLMFFYTYFWHKFGQTLAMKTWRFQLVDEKTHQLPSYKKCVIRNFAAIFSFLTLGFGYWCKLFHPQRKMLHDVLSGTKLILLKQ